MGAREYQGVERGLEGRCCGIGAWKMPEPYGKQNSLQECSNKQIVEDYAEMRPREAARVEACSITAACSTW